MRLELSAPLTVDAAPADAEPRRTISGIAVPYGVTAHASTGRVRFEPGSLDVTARPKLLRDHDATKPVGIVTELVDTDEGLLFSAKFSATQLADETLALAADGVLDSVSVGVDVLDHELQDGVVVVKAGRFRELSVLPWGAFEQAKITTVAAEEAIEAMPQAGAQPETPADPVDVEETPETADEAAAPSEEDTNMAEATIPTAPLVIHAAPKKLITPGEYIHAMISDPEGFRVLAADMDTGDTPGILPTPIVGPVYDGLAAARPLINAVGVRPMPRGGKVFIRPVITDRTAVDEQADELDTLASQAMVIDDVQLTKATYGGYVRISFQDLGFTDPGVLDILVTDLAKSYARKVEQVACGLAEAATNTETEPDYTDGEEILSWIYDAAADINTNTGYMPNAIMCDPGTWAALGKSIVNGTALFPSLNPMSAFGSLNAASTAGNPLGLGLVVSNQFAANTFIVGNTEGIEFFEDQRGSLSVDEPSTLGRIVSFHGYFVGHIIDQAKFVRAVPAP